MKIVGLVSGGKDSCFVLVRARQNGHQIVALANLYPAAGDDLDSFMFQTVGHEAVSVLAAAADLPLIRRVTQGKAVANSMSYSEVEGDEVEDLYQLLKEVKERFPDVQGVASGAILSNYQRIRVENVCVRLGLTSLSYLWQRDQHELLDEMVDAEMDAVLVKVASAGLKTAHLGQSIESMKDHLHQVHKLYGVNVCGEGGEYETLTVDCPLFTQRIHIDSLEKIVVSDDRFAPTAYARVTSMSLVPKSPETLQRHAELLATNVPPLPIAAVPPIRDPSWHDTCVHQVQEVSNCDNHSKVLRIAAVGGRICVEGLQEPQNGPVGQEMRSVLLALKEHLRSHGSDLNQIYRVVLFLADLNDFSAVNASYIEFFRQTPPSRVCVQTPLSRGARVQLHCVAGPIGLEREVLHVQSLSEWAPANIGPYSQAVKANGVVHIAGQIALDPRNQTLAFGDASRQAALALRHAQRIATAMGADIQRSLLVVCYVTGSAHGPAAHAVYKQSGVGGIVLFVGVPALPRGALVEWEFLTSTTHDIEVQSVAEHCQVARDSASGTYVIKASALTCKEMATHLARALSVVGASWPALAAVRVFAQTDLLDMIPTVLQQHITELSGSLSSPAIGVVGTLWEPSGLPLSCVAYVYT